MTKGPIQFVAIAFENDEHFHGQIRKELDSVRGHGVVRLVDALFLHKDATGGISLISDHDKSDRDQAEYGAVLHQMAGFGAATAPVEDGQATIGAFGLTQAELRQVIDTIPPGKAVGLLLFEHTWATGLAAAIREAGGRPVAQAFLTGDMLMVGGE